MEHTFLCDQILELYALKTVPFSCPPCVAEWALTRKFQFIVWLTARILHISVSVLSVWTYTDGYVVIIIMIMIIIIIIRDVRILRFVKTCGNAHSTKLQYKYKKLITRWDSERELFLQRHRTRTTKYKTYCSTNQSKRKFCKNCITVKQTCSWIWK